MKVVILAGGFGTRISEESQYKPKPMVEIGGMPILWHIMKEYFHYGHNEFIICAGYQQSYIKDWFANYFRRNSDISFDFTGGKEIIKINDCHIEPWKVSIVDTGLNTMTGGRIKRIQKYIGDEPFFMTYGDGVCDININDLLAFHQKHGKTATLTAVRRVQDKGTMDIGNDHAVRAFREKPQSECVPVNAGYMVLQPEVFDYIKGDETIFECCTLETLAEKGELMSYFHNGFWQCMDNMHEKNILERMLETNQAPWKKWD